MSNQEQNHYTCPDISSNHTQWFLSQVQVPSDTQVCKIIKTFAIPPAQKTKKQMVCLFEQDQMTMPRYMPAEEGNSEIAEAFDFLSCWEDGFKQFEQLTFAICILNDTTISNEYKDLSVGSSSVSIGLPNGYMCVTADNGLGCSQGMMREMAHLKLRLRGVNERDQSSPVLIDFKTRTVGSIINSKTSCPVNTALHDLYTSAHILELDLHICKKKSDAELNDQVQQLLVKNMTRVYLGVSTLLPELNCNPEWKPFIDALRSWCLSLINQVTVVLKSTPYRMYNLERRMQGSKI